MYNVFIVNLWTFAVFTCLFQEANPLAAATGRSSAFELFTEVNCQCICTQHRFLIDQVTAKDHYCSFANWYKHTEKNKQTKKPHC